MVDVLLLSHLLVRELHLAVEVLKARGLAEADELIMNEAIWDVVAVIHHCLTLILYKVLDKSISADGNPEANVAVNYKGLGGEQRTEARKAGIGSEQALCSRVLLSRRCARDEDV